MHILRRSLLSAGIMQADRPVKFMGYLKRILDVSCLKYPFPIGPERLNKTLQRTPTGDSELHRYALYGEDTRI